MRCGICIYRGHGRHACTRSSAILWALSRLGCGCCLCTFNRQVAHCRGSAVGSLAVMDSHSHWHCNVCSWNSPPSHFSSSKCHDGVLHGSDGSDGLAQPSNEATQSQQDLHTIYLLHEVAPKPHVCRLAWGALCPLPLLRSGMGPLLRVSRMPAVVCSNLLRSASPHQFSRATWQSIHFLSISASEYAVWFKIFL